VIHDGGTQFQPLDLRIGIGQRLPHEGRYGNARRRGQEKIVDLAPEPNHHGNEDYQDDWKDPIARQIRLE
jgi:hypothetical protein